MNSHMHVQLGQDEARASLCLKIRLFSICWAPSYSLNRSKNRSKKSETCVRERACAFELFADLLVFPNCAAGCKPRARVRHRSPPVAEDSWPRAVPCLFLKHSPSCFLLRFRVSLGRKYLTLSVTAQNPSNRVTHQMTPDFPPPTRP